jgi:UPF0271 protein
LASIGVHAQFTFLPTMREIDLNCDLGEGGAHDAALMPLVTSVNIACGAHAGDAATMRATVALAQRHGTAIGAHPGFADRENFGRLELRLSPDEITRLVRGQVEALRALAPLRHVKPHGALYNLAAREPAVARAVAEAVRDTDATLVLVGLAGSASLAAGRAAGLRVAGEFFADRGYAPDGVLAPRGTPAALLSPEAAVAQVLRWAETGKVRATDGTDIAIGAETVCVHGDGPHALELARALRAALTSAGVALRAFPV